MDRPSLRETQRWLAGVILDPGRIERSGTAPLGGDPETVRARLGAYVGGYPARLEEALAEIVPAVRHVLGAQAFHALVHRYLPHVPRGVYSLSDVGANLPAVLAADGDALPFLADLARLELAVHAAFHAALAPPFDPTALAAWTPEAWEGARLRFQPGVALVRSPWPIHDVWEARRVPRAAIDIAIEGRPHDVLVHRAGERVAAVVLAAPEADTLADVLDGLALGAAMERLAERGGAAEQASAWLGGWVGRGLVAAVTRG